MKTKIAVVGTGTIAAHHVRWEAVPDAVVFPDGEAEFVAVMDVDENRATSFAEKYAIPGVYTNVDELLRIEKPDIVIIATPPQTHAALCLKAMEAGSWVLCEKPLCASLEELDAIHEAEKRTGQYCSSVFQFRFGGSTRHIKRMVEEEIAGKPLVGICHTTWYRDAAYYEVDWRGTWASELGGPTMIHGIHAMDAFLWTMGDWTEVRALCACLDRDIEVEDVSSASVRFRNGAVGNILNSVLCPHENTFMRYDFQKGTAWTEGAVYDLNKDKWRFKSLESMDPVKAEIFQQITADTPTKQPSQLRAMVADFHAGRRPLVSGPETRRTIEFITALYKSAATGRPVEAGTIVAGDPFYAHVAGTYAQITPPDAASALRSSKLA